MEDFGLIEVTEGHRFQDLQLHLEWLSVDIPACPMIPILPLLDTGHL